MGNHLRYIHIRFTVSDIPISGFKTGSDSGQTLGHFLSVDKAKFEPKSSSSKTTYQFLSIFAVFGLSTSGFCLLIRQNLNPNIIKKYQFPSIFAVSGLNQKFS